MKLLFDHNLSPSLVNSLAELYPNSNHLYLMQLDQESDYTVWEIAKNQDYIIVTKDDMYILFNFIFFSIYIKNIC